MRMREFVKENRTELERCIKNHLAHKDGVYYGPKLSAQDIEQWIANDEGLYLWAKQEGVKV